MDANTLPEIRRAFQEGTYCLTKHVLDRLLERNIRMLGLRDAVVQGNPEIIEDSPNDERGPSCLIWCVGVGRVTYHVHCCYPRCGDRYCLSA